MAGYHQAHDNAKLKDARKDAGSWLKKLRTDAGVTQLAIAQACGYDYVTFISQIEAGKGRIRPVLMTAAAMIIGMLPMAMANSQNAPLGRAVMGGLFVATLFTLFFVPCVYAIIYQRRTVLSQEGI